MADGQAVLDVVAGGLITLLTATFTQVVAERFKREDKKRDDEKTRQDNRRASQVVVLDDLLARAQELDEALDVDRDIDYETADSKQARAVRAADGRFRGVLPQVDDEAIVAAGKAWRVMAKKYAASRPGDVGGPTLNQVIAARESMDDLVGAARRKLNAGA